jgi:formiminotetrahydrofolate cyclodeaminase
MKAFKMSKDTDDKKKIRAAAIQEGYKTASRVPLETAKICNKILDLSLIVAKNGNQNSITDAGVAAIMAKAGIESAILNVKINLGSIKDEKYVKSIMKDIDDLRMNCRGKIKEIEKIMDKLV